MQGCSLVVMMVRVYQSDSIALAITGYFCTPQKASIGMYSRCDYLLFVYFFKGWSLLYLLWLDLRPGSRGSHWVTKVFHKWSPGHGANIAIPRSQSSNMDEVVRHVKY